MKKPIIIIVAVLLIAAAVYYYMNPGANILESIGLKKAAIDPVTGAAVKDDLSGKTATSGNFVPQAEIVRDSNGFPLQQGISGSLFSPDKSVKEVQKALNERHGTSLKLDGVYGPKTAKALNVHGYPALIYLEDYYEILGV